MKDTNGYEITPHTTKYNDGTVCHTCGWPVEHELHAADAVAQAAATPADERETAQWFSHASQSALVLKAMRQFPDAFQFGLVKSWNRLPIAAKDALRLTFARSRTLLDQ